jgi:DNA repair protein RadC
MKLPEFQIIVKKKNKVHDSIIIKSSEDAHRAARMIFNDGTILWTEEMILMCLDRKNEIIAVHKVSSGGTSSVLADPKVIFTLALRSLASGIIVAHNHPSGNLTASREDINLTKRLVQIGEIFDIKIFDHLILSDDGYLSMADNGDM